MSHLLNRLACRALGIAPVVTSVIEPVRTPAFDSDPSARLHAHSQQTQGSESADTSHTAHHAEFRDRVYAAEPASSNANQSNRSDSTHAPATQGVQANQQKIVPTAAVLPAQDPLLDNTSDRTKVISGTEHGKTGHSEVDQTPANQTAPRADVLQPRAIEVAELTHAPLAPKRVADDSNPRTSHAVKAIKQNTLLEPRENSADSFSAAASALQSSTHLASGAQSTQPAIQVTIGRIEVRAATSPSPPQAPRQKTQTRPLLSLEDYLKQRTEAGQ